MTFFWSVPNPSSFVQKEKRLFCLRRGRKENLFDRFWRNQVPFWFFVSQKKANKAWKNYDLHHCMKQLVLVNLSEFPLRRYRQTDMTLGFGKLSPRNSVFVIRVETPMVTLATKKKKKKKQKLVFSREVGQEVWADRLCLETKTEKGHHFMKL